MKNFLSRKFIPSGPAQILAGLFVLAFPLACSKHKSEQVEIDSKFFTNSPARNTNLIEIEIQDSAGNTEPLPVDLTNLLESAKISQDVRIENGKVFITVFQSPGESNFPSPVATPTSKTPGPARSDNPNFSTIVMSEKNWTEMREKIQSP